MKHNDLKYFAYCRKSSEDSQRQIASIDDQTNALKIIVEKESLNLVHIPFTEERSSKDPGRPVFNDMLDRIEKGEANAVLCWDIDRLYRNPVDEGRLRWMLQKGVIRTIMTPNRQFYPEDAGLLMGVEGGRATDYVIRLSKNVKRGLGGKVLKGIRPGSAPIGYLNVGEVGNRTIVKDEIRFEIVRKMWDLFLTGTYSVSKICKIANNEWGLRTKTRRKIGGKPLSMSHMYRLFGDPFYYGYFQWTNYESGVQELYKGTHPIMITENEYKRAQVLMGKHGKIKPQNREFAFTGLMHCGECDSMITAEEKNQIICSCKNKFAYENKTECPKCGVDISEMHNPTILNYVYYHCTKKKNPQCTQKAIRLEDLEKQFNKVLADIKIDENYLKIALDYLHDKQGNAGSEEKAMRQSVQITYDSCQTQLVNLHREYTSPQNSNHELYSSEEFKKQKTDIVTERDRLENELNKVKETLDQSLEATERVFNFCAFAQYHFNNAKDMQKKREIFSTIGSNLTLMNRELKIERLHPYMLIENELRSQKALHSRLEPKKYGSTKEKEVVLTTSSPTWLRDQGSNLGHPP